MPIRIINTYVISSRGSSDEGTIGENKNFGSEDKLYLLSPQEVYGTSFVENFDTSNGTSRQLDYYSNNNVSTSNYANAIKKNGGSAAWWWMRSAYSNYEYSFYFIDGNGSYTHDIANSSNGVSPAFRLAA